MESNLRLRCRFNLCKQNDLEPFQELWGVLTVLISTRVERSWWEVADQGVVKQHPSIKGEPSMNFDFVTNVCELELKE